MADERIKIVVAEGGAEDPGLLRFVLEGEGFEVVAEVATAADLVRAAGTEQPDVVVLDEAIGRSAIAMTRAASPSAKVILVSPEEHADVDVDGWVALPHVVRGLGIAVLRACASPGTLATEPATDAFVRPEWVDRIRKDPATLREILASGSKRGVEDQPSISALQRRSAGSRLHPSMLRRREKPAAGLDALAKGVLPSEPPIEPEAEPQGVQPEIEQIAVTTDPTSSHREPEWTEPDDRVSGPPGRRAHPHKR